MAPDTLVKSRPARRHSRRTTQPPTPKMTKLQLIGLVLGIVLFFAPMLIDIPDLEPSAARMLGIFFLAIVFWLTSPVPLFATAILVILLEVLLISDQALLPVSETAPSYAEFFATLANPTVILFMGGFMIANAAAKFDVDKAIAARVLAPFKTVRSIVFALMLVTTVLSQFVSNTATTATMFAVILPILALMPTDKARTGLALAIPVAASIGGMGTPVSSPPNAITVATLAERGTQVSFTKWMMLAIPPMLILIVFAYILITVLFLPKSTPVDLNFKADFSTKPKAITFYVIALTTIGLWLTEPLHGISSNVVGFFPVVALILTGVMSGKDIQELDWPTLWLVAGGIALGSGISKSGLDVYLLDLIDWGSLGPFQLVLGLGVFTLVMGTFISNTAIANLLIPLATTIAVSAEVNPTVVAMVIGLTASVGIALPISTPPMAIAYSTGHVKVKDMATVGVAIGVFAIPIIMILMPWLWTTLGLL